MRFFTTRTCKIAFILWFIFKNNIKHCKNQLTMLIITQYYCIIFSNCMWEHRKPYFRPLDRGRTDCDLKWRCVDVHEDITWTFSFRGDVTNVVSRAWGATILLNWHLWFYFTQVKRILCMFSLFIPKQFNILFLSSLYYNKDRHLTQSTVSDMGWLLLVYEMLFTLSMGTPLIAVSFTLLPLV